MTEGVTLFHIETTMKTSLLIQTLLKISQSFVIRIEKNRQTLFSVGRGKGVIKVMMMYFFRTNKRVRYEIMNESSCKNRLKLLE